MNRMLAAVLGVSAAATAAHAGPLRLGKGFTPNPMILPEVSVTYDETRIYDLGYKTCDPGGGSFTTSKPAMTFELTDDLPELSVRFEDRAGNDSGQPAVIVAPDGTYYCDDNHSEVFARNWKRGTYKIYFYSSTRGGGATIRFEIPARAKADVEKVKQSLPTITLGASGVSNPQWVEVKPTASAEAGDLGIGCGRHPHDRVMPLAKVEVTRPSQWFIGAGKQELFLVTPDNTCVDPGDQPALAAGTHVLWTVVGRDGTAPPRVSLEIDDRARALAFAAADHKPVGALDEPLTIAGTVRAAEPGAHRNFTCTGVARQPDFYLTSDKPLQHVELSLLWGRAEQSLHVFGPLAEMKPNSLVNCGEDNHGRYGFDVFEGEYAVWIGGEVKAAGTAWHVLVRRTDVAVDPMTALAPIPKDLTLAERALKNHYPFFDGDKLTDWTAAFTRAPDQLFVYPRTDSTDDDVTVAAGEPLLVAWSNADGKTSAYRFDGRGVSLDTRLVTTERPATVVLPTRLVPREPSSLTSAISDAGPEDARAIAAYGKIDDRYTACLGNYMAKNDPTWTHSGDLYKISRSGKVTNVSDEIGERGSRKCGGAAFERAGTKLEKALAKTRAARYQAHLAAVRKRFGL